MPKLDGQGTLLALRVLAPKLPVLLTSGHSENKISQRFLRSSLAGFLPKPFTAGRLLSSVADAIRAARSVN
jgi:two-component system C4-dicarboxylate transport response regulator DctD